MKCEFHPNVNADAICENCKTPICGICSRFVDEGVLCEKCEDFSSLSDFVEKQQNTKNEKVEQLLSEVESRLDNTNTAEPTISHNPDIKEKVQMGLVIISCIFITYQITGSFRANAPLTQQQIQVEESQRFQIESCMLVFWDIAQGLANGEEPDDSLRCEETGLPMLIARENGDLRVSHPRPDLLGLTDIYVTRSNPTPILVE